MFDPPVRAEHNGIVRRALLIVLAGLAVLMWPTRPHDRVPAALGITLSSDTPCAMADGSQAPSDKDRQWHLGGPSPVAVGESFRKSPQTHANLASNPLTHAFERVRASRSPDPPARSSQPHLRHTPLLI
jgi:hypothetical protein